MSLSVVLSAIGVAAGAGISDPIIGLVIARITWQSWRTVQADPGAQYDEDEHDHGAHEHAKRGAPRPAHHD